LGTGGATRHDRNRGREQPGEEADRGGVQAGDVGDR